MGKAGLVTAGAMQYEVKEAKITTELGYLDTMDHQKEEIAI